MGSGGRRASNWRNKAEVRPTTVGERLARRWMSISDTVWGAEENEGGRRLQEREAGRMSMRDAMSRGRGSAPCAVPGLCEK